MNKQTKWDKFLVMIYGENMFKTQSKTKSEAILSILLSYTGIVVVLIAVIMIIEKIYIM